MWSVGSNVCRLKVRGSSHQRGPAGCGVAPAVIVWHPFRPSRRSFELLPACPSLYRLLLLACLSGFSLPANSCSPHTTEEQQLAVFAPSVTGLITTCLPQEENASTILAVTNVPNGPWTLVFCCYLLFSSIHPSIHRRRGQVSVT